MAETLGAEHLVEDTSDPLAADALQRGTRLGRYELLVPIAVGGMARVWAARLHGQRGFTKLVAIKTILPHLASDPEFERMLIDEARIASGVRHPNVCEIYELGDERGVLYVAMEWVHGDSMSHVLKVTGAAEPLDPRIAARVVADAAAGLHAAHNLIDEEGKALQVVHRDVSPHNLLVSLDGNVKVTDFGVAKALGTSHQATVAGQLKGKINYMAPEQATGSAVDRRSDVFSLGCVLYEATTGRQPFKAEGEHAILQELLKGAFPPPSRVVRGYPYELERILVRAMAQQPLHRYPTMDQMRLALEEWLAKSGPVVTQSHVAAVVRERIGAEVERRRERIKTASNAIADKTDRDLPIDPAQMTPSGVQPAGATPPKAIRASVPSYESLPVRPPGAPAPPPVMELATRTPSGVQYAMAAALGVIAAVVLGASVFWVWRSMQPAPAPAVARVEPAAAAARPTASATPVEAKPTASAAPAPPIQFKVIPEQAQLVVDGKTLEASVRSVPRPAHGASTSVVVHAEGFADQTLTIDDTAPTSVDVWLDPLPTKKKSEGSKGEGSGSKAPELLPNPY